MKRKYLFLFVAALIMTVFSSCSSDDEPASKPDYKNYASLNVQVEELKVEDNTRSAFNPSGNIIYWQTGDGINVYDEELMTYDEYSYSPSKKAFVTDADKSNIEGTISYALYPMDLVDYAGWTSKGNRAVINLPAVIEYNENSEDVTTASGTTLYRGCIPMWGKATGEFGKVEVSLKYLSAVFKLKLDKSKATFIKIYSEAKPLSGGFEAVIAKDGQTEVEPIVKQGGKSLGTQKYVIVDLRKMTSDEGYVYVPIVPDMYNDLTVATTKLDVAEGESLTKAQIADETNWTTVKKYPSGKEIKRATCYVIKL